MIVSLVLMVLFFFVLGVFAAQNSGTHDFVLFNLVWSQVPLWVPAVLSAAVMFVLMLLYAGYARIRHTMGRLTLRRRIDSNEAMISDLRAENERLRGQVARRVTVRQEPAREPTGGIGDPTA
jgi:uncharacterized integral membrane protein